MLLTDCGHEPGTPSAAHDDVAMVTTAGPLMSLPQTQGYVCRLTGHVHRNRPSCDTPGKIPAGKEAHSDKM